MSFPDVSFDLVLQATVFTSVLDESVRAGLRRDGTRAETRGNDPLVRLLRSQTRVTGVRAIGRREIARLFAGCDVSLRRATLAPPIARLVAPYSWWACGLLEQVSLLRTHYLGVIRRTA